MNLQTDFSSQTIRLAPDYEGEVIATLVASNFNVGNRKSVLYLHGYIDYFFQVHMAEKFIENGFDFFALDLRKYGRSLMRHQHPNYCKDISEYFEEITVAIKQIHANSAEVYLLGHSTGGLIASNYMNDGEAKDLIKALILNSPFFEFNQSSLENLIVPFAAKIIAGIAPYSCINGALSPVWAQNIHKDYKGEWDFDLNWKPIKGFPTYFKWVYAIHEAQKKLQHSNIQVPVLLMHSERSAKPDAKHKGVLTADIVLNVADMKRIGPKLGKNVKMCSIDNGYHDLILSPKQVRDVVFNELFSWLKEH